MVFKIDALTPGGNTSLQSAPNITKTESPEKCASRPRREAWFFKKRPETIGAKTTFQLGPVMGVLHQDQILLPTSGGSNNSDCW